VAVCASCRGGVSCLLATPLEMCGSTITATRPVVVVNGAYPPEDFYPSLHLAKAIGLLYLYLISLRVIVWYGYGHGYEDQLQLGRKRQVWFILFN